MAVGLVADPVTDIAARAEVLRWPGVPTQRAAGEARLPGLTSPSGVHVFVSASSDRPDFWQHDFEAYDGQQAASTWTGIDHVGTAVGERHVNAETSFYRGLFGLATGPVSEFMEPHGRMRSRVLRPAAGNLRVVLNVDDSDDDVRHGINQLAFACTDLRSEVRGLRARGVELLEVPDNYYADLEARFGLDEAFLTDLREHGLFYDRIGDGELLHAYTPLVDGHFYVELLERRNGYAGFGSDNTAVRLALQGAGRHGGVG